jgi:molecular chaperone GrpE
MEDKKPNELEELKQKTEEYLNGWKRERADFINYKKDEMERIGQLVKYANEEIILKILPILDNLILAANHIKDNGLTQIQKQLEDFLAKEGIVPIEVLDKPFDPATMESVGEVVGVRSDLAQSGIVIEEAQRGYTMHGKLIRPAKVKISK